MHRRWCSKRIIDRCRLVKESLDRPALTTDVIVGFPGETAAHFAETLNVVREIGFSKIHQFPFSARRGTPAAEMPDQIPPPVKAARLEALAETATELRDQYYTSLRGMPLRVLIESPVPDRPGSMLGTACRYAPVEVPGTIAMRKQFADVVAGKVCNGLIQAVGMDELNLGISATQGELNRSGKHRGDTLNFRPIFWKFRIGLFRRSQASLCRKRLGTRFKLLFLAGQGCHESFEVGQHSLVECYLRAALLVVCALVILCSQTASSSPAMGNARPLQKNRRRSEQQLSNQPNQRPVDDHGLHLPWR